MPKAGVTRDKQIARVDAAAGSATLTGSGSAGGSLRPVNYTPGRKVIFNDKK